MKNNFLIKTTGIIFILLSVWSCKSSQITFKEANKNVPEKFDNTSGDTVSVAHLSWKEYFADQHLIALIDTALGNNQELNILLQEIEISRNEIKARKGEYLPFVNAGLSTGFDKSGKYTRFGALEEHLEVKEGTHFPEPLTDLYLGFNFNWEIDIWKKLRNAKQAAATRYLASIEGRNFMVTQLVSEISDAYYELMALDNLLSIVEQNIDIQSNALKVVKMQKESAKVSQLAVNRFEAQLLNTQNLQFEIKQKIVEAENRIKFLTGRFSQPVVRSSGDFLNMQMNVIQAGIPSQLLDNRPDIRQAELNLAASKLDVKVAKANFYPSLGINAGIGFQAFNPKFIFNPESFLYNLAGDLLAPVINRNAIKAEYNTATAKQIQAVYEYEKTVLNAYVDVLNQLSRMSNYTQSYDTKSKEVDILLHSVSIANNLFNSARADYAEVLLTQKEALESKMEMIEIKMKQLNAKVNIYRALGGGWR